MKKSTPWAIAQAEYETRIRQDERVATLAGLWEHLHRLERRMVDLFKALEALKEQMPSANRDIKQEPVMTSGLAPTRHHDFVGGIERAQSAPKRRATTANQEQIDEALRLLRSLWPPGEPLTPKQMAATWKKGFGGKISAAAALRALVASGNAIEIKRGKFKAEMKKEADNGMGETDTAAR